MKRTKETEYGLGYFNDDFIYPDYTEDEDLFMNSEF
jgi:hypothetical protein